MQFKKEFGKTPLAFLLDLGKTRKEDNPSGE